MRLNKIVLGFALAVSITPIWAQTITLKLGHIGTTTSAIHLGSMAMAEEFAKLTQGRYKINVLASGALGGEKEIIEGLKSGEVELANLTTGAIGNFVPETLITDLPFLFRDYDHARKVLDGPIGQEILTKFPAKGMIAVTWGENGFRHLTNNKRAVNVPDDLKGIKLRTMENQVHMTVFKTLGAMPAPMPFTELFSALQQGTVDGQENPIQLIISSKFGQVQKNLSMTGHVYSPTITLASPKIYNAMSAADKKALLDSAKVGTQVMRKRVVEVESTGIAELKAMGVAVVTNIDKSKFETALAPVYAEFSKKFGAEAIQRIRDVK